MEILEKIVVKYKILILLFDHWFRLPINMLRD